MKNHRVPVRFTGQHFTIDTILINDAIRLANINKEDLVLDIGAGRGFITIHLAKYAKNVVAIENDKRLISDLKSKFNSNKKVIITGIDYCQYRVPKKNFKVVSNIPFGITSYILKSLMFVNMEYFQSGSLILQLEPAQKLTKQCFFNPYTVFYHTFFDLELVYEISPQSFIPPPTITSALLKIKKKGCIQIADIKSKEKYLGFLHFMLKFPELPARTVLKKIFRKRQINGFTKTFKLNLDNTVSSMSPKQFLGCYLTMEKVVPSVYHPKQVETMGQASIKINKLVITNVGDENKKLKNQGRTDHKRNLL